MATTYKIPLSSIAETFLISLGGVQYRLTLAYRTGVFGGWFLDIADSSDVAIVSGIPLVVGLDLLEQYAYLDFGGELWVQTDGGSSDVPTYSNLGTTSNLYFVVP